MFSKLTRSNPTQLLLVLKTFANLAVMIDLILIVSEVKRDYSSAMGDFTRSSSEARRCMRGFTRASRASDCCKMRRNSLSANSRLWISARLMSSTSRGQDFNAANIMLGALDPLRWYLRLLFEDWSMASSFRHSWGCIGTENFAVNPTAFRGSELGLREDWGVLAFVIVVEIVEVTFVCWCSGVAMGQCRTNLGEEKVWVWERTRDSRGFDEKSLWPSRVIHMQGNQKAFAETDIVVIQLIQMLVKKVSWAINLLWKQPNFDLCPPSWGHLSNVMIIVLLSYGSLVDEVNHGHKRIPVTSSSRAETKNTIDTGMVISPRSMSKGRLPIVRRLQIDYI